MSHSLSDAADGGFLLSGLVELFVPLSAALSVVLHGPASEFDCTFGAGMRCDI